MTHILRGDRLGRQGTLRLGCSAVIFDASKEKILLTRRTDNGQWCLPGGAIEPGESVSEACQREVLEETGLQVRILRLVGVFSDPDRLVVYPDGNKVQIVALNFEAEITGGELGLSNETTAFGWFSLDEMSRMDILDGQFLRIQAAFSGKESAFVC